MKRIYQALLNSWAGCQVVFAEKAFKQELVLAVVLIPLSWFIAATPVEFLLLNHALLQVLLAEIFNTAIESCIDRVGPEIHRFSKMAKDLGSLAVMLAMLWLLIVWCVIIYL